MQKCIQLFIRVNFIIIVTDKNDVIYILSKLDVLSKNIINISNEFKMEVIKLKTYFSIPDSTLDKKPWESIPEKFFHDFLKPLLEKKKKMTKKEMLKEAEKQNKYNSQNTLNQYLPILESKGFIKSTKDKREKVYTLKPS